jgi:hypothetical protein
VKNIRGKLAGEWVRQHNKELYIICNFWVIKKRRMRWVGHVAHMGKRRSAYWVLVVKPE